MQIAARTGAWAKSGGGKLPYDSELQFATLSANSYIDIVDVVAYVDFDSIEMTFAAGIAGSRYFVANSSSESTANAGGFGIIVNASNLYFFDYGGRVRMSGVITKGEFATVRLDTNLGLAEVVGVKSISTTKGSITPSSCLRFGANASFSSDILLSTIKIFRNGYIVKNMIPVRKDGSAYLYDITGCRLYGATYGDLIPGPDKVGVVNID